MTITCLLLSFYLVVLALISLFLLFFRFLAYASRPSKHKGKGPGSEAEGFPLLSKNKHGYQGYVGVDKVPCGKGSNRSKVLFLGEYFGILGLTKSARLSPHGLWDPCETLRCTRYLKKLGSRTTPTCVYNCYIGSSLYWIIERHLWILLTSRKILSHTSLG